MLVVVVVVMVVGVSEPSGEHTRIRTNWRTRVIALINN